MQSLANSIEQYLGMKKFADLVGHNCTSTTTRLLATIINYSIMCLKGRKKKRQIKEYLKTSISHVFPSPFKNARRFLDLELNQTDYEIQSIQEQCFNSTDSKTQLEQK